MNRPKTFEETTYFHAALLCPCCLGKIDASTCLSEEVCAPSPGDSSLCSHCATILRFDRGTDGGLMLREPSEEEFADLPTDTIQELNRLQNLRLKMGGLGRRP